MSTNGIDIIFTMVKKSDLSTFFTLFSQTEILTYNIKDIWIGKMQHYDLSTQEDLRNNTLVGAHRGRFSHNP